jgi:hypothetical protein
LSGRGSAKSWGRAATINAPSRRAGRADARQKADFIAVHLREEIDCTERVIVNKCREVVVVSFASLNFKLSSSRN